MRRWNGWGDDSVEYHLSESAFSFLQERLGSAQTLPDVSYDEMITTLPNSRLPDHPSLCRDPEERLRHARGQSLPDWISLRHGIIDCFPDGVAFPSNVEEVRSLLITASDWGARIIPYGGGTSVVGHINPTPGDRPVLTVDMGRINQLLDLDEESLLARFGSGIVGPELERILRRHGYTLGHFPQSFEYSTLGGWVATRSSGQQSTYYGRIEDMFAGGHIETPRGWLDIEPLPASGAGPDLRHIVLGSEGRLGIITHVDVRIRPAPQVESFHAALFREWESGFKAVKDLVQSDVPLSMLRLSDAIETQSTLALSGRDNLVKWAGRGLELLRYGPERCLLLFGLTGDRDTYRLAKRKIKAAIGRFGGLYAGSMIGTTWEKGRFHTAYLRNTLWNVGFAVDTLETAIPWSKVDQTRRSILDALLKTAERMDRRILAFTHLSHVYTDGASIYVTYIFRRTADPYESLEFWQKLKAAASRAIIEHKGTISHQHGVGLDHRPYMLDEKGAHGLDILNAVLDIADPDQMMNPGKLLPDDGYRSIDAT